MPVYRYRDVAEMPPPDAGNVRDPAYRARVEALLRFAGRTLPLLYEPGVHRFRSIEEAQAAREKAVIRRMRALRRARQGT